MSAYFRCPALMPCASTTRQSPLLLQSRNLMQQSCRQVQSDHTAPSLPGETWPLRQGAAGNQDQRAGRLKPHGLQQLVGW